MCFHLNLMGSDCLFNDNDEISPEEHFESSKTRRGTLLLLELFIFVHMFEFYLVTQSL